MKNLIFNAFARGEHSELNRKTKNYYECCVVSLCSARQVSPNDDIALITNTDVPDTYRQMLINNDISIIKVDFDSFQFEKSMNWALAFYKLCALKYVADYLDYDNYLMVDTDTFFQGSVDDIWEETKSNILLYATGHRISHPQVVGMRDCYKEMYQKDISLIHYGGEFFASNRLMLQQFMEKCEDVYKKMIETKVRTTQGDEFITSIVATEDRQSIKAANAYIHRYWTGKTNIVSTNYKFDPVSILHLPSEKDAQFPLLYRYYKSRGRFPRNIHWVTCMPKARRRPQYVMFKILAKLILH